MASFWYEPHRFELGNGITYLPDFYISQVAGYGKFRQLYIEIKGFMEDADVDKLSAFHACREMDFVQNEHYFIVLPTIPRGTIFKGMWDLISFAVKSNKKGCAGVKSVFKPFSGEFYYDNHDILIPGVDVYGNFMLFSPNLTEGVDEAETLFAYNNAICTEFIYSNGRLKMIHESI